MTKISVVMSTFNTPEEYLRSSIESILCQTLKDFEFIIVDDGSTNNDVSIVQSYHDDRVKIIENHTNMGLPYSLNRALSVAKGKYIVRMDSDDISLPTRLQCQYEYMEDNRDISVAGCFATKIGSKSGIMGALPKNIDLKTYLLLKNPIIHPSTIIRKDFLVQYKLLYDLECSRGQDYELWARVALYGKISIIPEFLLKYRFHDNQLTRDSCKEIQRDNGIALYNKFLPKYGIELDMRLYEAYYDLVNARPLKEIGQLKELYDSLCILIKSNSCVKRKEYKKYLDYFYFYNLIGNLFIKRYSMTSSYCMLICHPVRFLHFLSLLMSFNFTKIKYKRLQPQ